MRLEFSRFDAQTLLAQQRDETLDQRLGDFGTRRSDEIGTAPAPRIRVERELRDNERARAQIERGAIEFARVILKNAERRDFLREPARIAFVIVVRDADENEQARVNRAKRLIVYRDGGLTYALKNSAHKIPPIAFISNLWYDFISGVMRMYKLLMTCDIRPGRESEYFEFAVQEFVPKLTRLGIQPTEAWYTVYGNAPQLLTGGVAADRATLEKVVESEEWKALLEKLLTYVTNFNYKLVPHTGHFQL